MPTTTFPCKEPNCSRTVTYERKIVYGAVLLEEAAPSSTIVYLQCDLGHEHSYTV